ncbi:hypothetical protein DESC_700071 [Desulfosarcina cetonica]|nr:hypothetical protein DESC_700071 [Desulfosarcina cetonica]
MAVFLIGLNGQPAVQFFSIRFDQTCIFKQKQMLGYRMVNVGRPLSRCFFISVVSVDAEQGCRGAVENGQRLRADGSRTVLQTPCILACFAIMKYYHSVSSNNLTLISSNTLERAYAQGSFQPERRCW